MIHMTPAAMAASCGGTYFGPEALSQKEISAVVTDSRKIVPDCLFIAIRGERSDGHTYIPQVMENGAMLVLTERSDTKDAYPCIEVASTLDAMKKIAHYYLCEVGAKVISVTGSVGKTSTKETIASVLAQKFRTKKTPGNFNNNIGLPMSIFTLEEGDEMAVLEMGINHFGEMDELASIAPPDISVITNIGTCHLEFLGDRDGVFRAKTEVFSHLKEGGRVILNGDDDKLRNVQEVGGLPPVFYGIESECGIYADNIEYIGMDAVRCMIHMGEEAFAVRIPYPGNHMVMNALAATAVGQVLGMMPFEIKAGIESLVLPEGRFHVVEGLSCRIIDDCYNANPMSMKASLKVLAEAPERRIAILGDMAELGKEERALHREVGEFAAKLPLELVITVGTLTKELADGIRENHEEMPVIAFDDNASCVRALPTLIREGDTVLVKASHSMHFEEIVDALRKI